MAKKTIKDSACLVQEGLKCAGSPDAITIGIILKIPYNKFEKVSYYEEKDGCIKCNRWGNDFGKARDSTGKRVPMDPFCKYCGSPNQIVMVKQEPEDVPKPDIRSELGELGLAYVPFSEDMEERGAWLIVLKEFDTFGHRGDYYGGALREYSVINIVKELEMAKKKYAAFAKKYKGDIYFGSISRYIDW